MLDIVILAAGKGSRMKSDLPKVLHPIAGKPMLEHVINTAQQLTERRLNIVIGHGAGLVEEELGPSHHYILQKQQLGTGHAVQQALDYFDNSAVVLILYGDVPLVTEATLRQLVAQVGTQSMGLLTINLKDPTGYGRIVRNTQGDVTAIVEQKDASETQQQIQEVNTGLIAINASHIKQWLPKLSNDNAQGEYYLTDLIVMAKAAGVVINTVQPSQHWEVLGVNNRFQQSQLERIYQQNIAHVLLQQGVRLLDPDRFDCRGHLQAKRDVVIDINCIFKGNVILGEGVSIGANCIIDNTIIAAGTVIKDHSIIEGSTIGEYCEIGPFARLRPGTVLANKAKIGNFVETKKADIGEGSKINHLSYVGDATLGSAVNIGAGTITCNYDGVNKHRTVIENNVFVGSNSALVAPLTVEEGATIGAGSTINKPVEKQTLALTRSPQKTIADWQRPTKKL